MTRRWPVDVRDVVRPPIDVEVFGPDRAPSAGEIRDRAFAARALVTSVADRIDASLLDALPSLEVVAQAAVGYDNVDVAACRARGVVVTHTPDVLTDSTAELTLALLLAVARRLREGEAMVRSGAFGGWSPTMLRGVELAGERLGVVGMGRIGRAVATRARAFGMDIAYSTRGDRPPGELRHAEGARWMRLAELLETSDVVTLHLQASAGARHLLGDRELAKM